MNDENIKKGDTEAKSPLSDLLLYQQKSVWDAVEDPERDRIFSFSEGYKSFLSAAKTERLAVREIINRAEAKGFCNGEKKHDGTKIYRNNRNKGVALIVPGKDDPTNGLNIIVSHIDSPRLDLKQRPLYEDADVALLKTHYYGGIKKYQWVSRPLALYGIVVRADGREVYIAIGGDPGDPVFTVSDLLPHLAGKAQMDKKVSEAIVGEKLNLICGSIPLRDKGASEKIKLAVLKILNDKYGLIEEDFISAELEAVPAGDARDIGFDRSLIGGYGQDDRASAYVSLEAALDLTAPKKTSVVFFVDKEEIGSDGVTGARGMGIEEVVLDVIRSARGKIEADDLIKTFSRSRCLCADVNGALDPDYQEVHEKRNAARLGYGVCITKFTGSRGKYLASDASAELVGEIRRLFNSHKVIWQYAELGKVDEGGGGTLAKDIAERGIDVLDVGPALLDMHSPFEISSKADIYMTYKGFRVFLES